MYSTRLGVLMPLSLQVLALLLGPPWGARLRAQTVSAYDTVAISPLSLELSYVSSLAVDSRGRVYLADAGRRRVVVLGTDAQPLSDIGRSGAGPGEFENVSSVEILPGDSLLVYDGQLSRITVFPPSKAVPARTISVLAGGGGRPMWVRASEDGGFVAGYEHSFVAGKPKQSDAERWLVIGLLNPAGVRVRDSLLVLRAPASLVMRQGGTVAAAPDPFGRDAIIRTRPGRLHYADTDSLSVREYSLSGSRLSTVNVQAKAIPLSRRIVDSVAGLGGPQYRQAVRRSAPTSWRPIRDFLVDDQDRLWVGLVSRPLSTVTWQILTRSGELRATLTLPWAYQLMAVQRGQLYGLLIDDDEVPRLLILRPRG